MQESPQAKTPAAGKTAAANPYAPPNAPLGRAPREGLAPHVKAGRVLRLLAWLGLIGWIGILAAIAIPMFAGGKSESPPGLVWVMLVLGTLYVWFMFALAGAVRAHKDWGRWVGILYGIVSLLGFPIGTLIGVYLLYLLIGGWADYDPELD